MFTEASLGKIGAGKKMGEKLPQTVKFRATGLIELGDRGGCTPFARRTLRLRFIIRLGVELGVRFGRTQGEGERCGHLPRHERMQELPLEQLGL